MAQHRIVIRNRIAIADAGIELVCNNPTDTIIFDFDSEWIAHTAKTARFSWDGNKIDIPFTGNVVQVPEIYRTNHVYIGVFADNITSTPAKVNCRYSIKCLGGKNPPPGEDVYNQIIQLINGAKALSPLGGTTNEITPMQVLDAMTEGRNVLLSYNHSEFGTIIFTSFALAAERGIILASAVVVLDDKVVLAQLTSTEDNGWACIICELEQKSE